MAPHSVAASTQRIVRGDFVMPVDSVTLPTEAVVGDTVRLTPHFAPGVDPCALSVVFWESDFTGVFLTFYGVRTPGPSCPSSVVALLADGAWAPSAPDADPAVERAMLLFVCHPDGDPLYRQVAVLRRADDLVWSDFNPPSAPVRLNVDASLRTTAEQHCSRARAALR